MADGTRSLAMHLTEFCDAVKCFIQMAKLFEGHDSLSEAPCQTTLHQPICEVRQWRLFSDSTSPRILVELRDTCCVSEKRTFLNKGR
ncbi:hypothetical protein AVEN_87722-1 [Araneus ventricosus]|uniref:Uncharacterized protein n=1 Tax=Araneus ventricosus TaxID=182803 RepID=A0A4Y2NVZ0_ARAVE|nr:hypothetical protein AVEN_87722-1 [Araneus ventricosus]